MSRLDSVIKVFLFVLSLGQLMLRLFIHTADLCLEVRSQWSRALVLTTKSLLRLFGRISWLSLVFAKFDQPDFHVKNNTTSSKVVTPLWDVSYKGTTFSM